MPFIRWIVPASWNLNFQNFNIERVPDTTTIVAISALTFQIYNSVLRAPGQISGSSALWANFQELQTPLRAPVGALLSSPKLLE